MDVFVSWTGSDRDVKNVIVNRILEEGLTCFESDQGCVEDFSAECIRNIRNCSVFVVLLSDAAMKPGSYVLNEVIHARKLYYEGKLNIVVYKLTDSPLSDSFEANLNHISDANHIARLRRLGPTGGIDVLIDRIKDLLKKRREGNPEKPCDVFVPQVTGVALGSPGYFVENSRTHLLEQLEDALTRSNVVVLNELFGFGKRTLIRKYAELHRGEYDSVVTASCSGGTLRDFLSDDLSFSNMNSEMFDRYEGNDRIREKIKVLQKLDSRHMIVVPSVKLDEFDVFLCDCLRSLSCRIVLITQDFATSYRDYFPILGVGRMDDDSLAELFFHHYDSADEEERAALLPSLYAFFSGIGGHTRTVELTAAVLSQEVGATPEEVPGYLQVQTSDSLKLRDRIFHQIGTVMDLERLSEDEKLALSVISLLGIPYLGEKQLRWILSDFGVEWKVVLTLHRRRWIDVDQRERKISMEPLIAEVCTRKFQSSCLVRVSCLQHLRNQYTEIHMRPEPGLITVLYEQISHYMTIIGFPEVSTFVRLSRNVLSGAACDPSALEEAISLFEKKHGSLSPEPLEDAFLEEEDDGFEDASSEDDGSEYDDEADDFGSPDDGFGDGEDLEEETAEPFSRENWEQLNKEVNDAALRSQAVAFCREMLIPSLSFATKAMENNLFDFRTLSDKKPLSLMLQKTSSFDYSKMLEQALALTESPQFKFYRSMHLLDRETETTFLALRMTDAFVKQDPVGIMQGLEDLMSFARKHPAVFRDSQALSQIWGSLSLLFSAFLRSGNSYAARSLCDELMDLPWPENLYYQFLGFKISAMECQKDYSDELYRCFSEQIELFDRVFCDAYQSRSEFLSAKKGLLLTYASAQIEGDDDAALDTFRNAQKIGRALEAEKTVECASTILHRLMSLDCSDLACEFLKEHFSPEVLGELSDRLPDSAMDSLEEISILLDLLNGNFSNEDVPEVSEGYYQVYSKENHNNSLAMNRYLAVAKKVESYDFTQLTDLELAAHGDVLRGRVARGEGILDVAPEAFALVSEAGFRTLGYRHHFVQYVGAAAMADGAIAEILNGEGKTYTIVLVAYLNCIFGRKTFVIDTSVSLTDRNVSWMGGVYSLLGLKTGRPSTRYGDDKREDYACPVIYVDLRTVTLDVLRQEVKAKDRSEELVLDSCCAIVDEADRLLVDEAVKPFAISCPSSEEDVLQYRDFCGIAERLAEQISGDPRYYERKGYKISFLQKVYPRIEEAFSLQYKDISAAPRLSLAERLLETALICREAYEKDTDYFIKNGRVMMEDTSLGELYVPRAGYAYFLHRLHGLSVDDLDFDSEVDRLYQNISSLCHFLRRFRILCGTSATVRDSRKELNDLYGLNVVSIPPHLPVQREDKTMPLYMTEADKNRAIVEEVKKRHSTGQPILLITGSTAKSGQMSQLLRRESIPHRVLNALNASDSSDLIASAGISGSVLIATALANRGVDIKLGGDPELLTRRDLVELGIDVTGLDGLVYSVPTQEQLQSELFRTYQSLLLKNRAKTLQNRRKVLDAGGLCVIGTEFFNELRVEQQARGRSGRQGDVGVSIMFRSLDDDLLKSFIPSNSSFLSQIAGDVSEVSMVAPLKQAMEKGRRTVRERRLKSTLELNSWSDYVEQGRAPVLGLLRALRAGTLTLETYFREWSKDKENVRAVLDLQQGSVPQGCEGVALLFRLYPDRFRGIRSLRVPDALFRVATEFFREQVSRKTRGRVSEEEFFGALLDLEINSVWPQYIALVRTQCLSSRTSGRQVYTDRALKQLFERERARLLRAVANKIFEHVSIASVR